MAPFSPFSIGRNNSRSDKDDIRPSTSQIKLDTYKDDSSPSPTLYPAAPTGNASFDPSAALRSPPPASTASRSHRRFHDFVDSFKRDPAARASVVRLEEALSKSQNNDSKVNSFGSDHTLRRNAALAAALGERPNGYSIEAAVANTATTPLARNLKGRHLQMIAIGGSIGTGLFVGSGAALATGGPASVVISFIMTGAMLYCTTQALGEMAVLFPVAGSFSAFATRFLDPAWGFAMGWNYALQWLVTLPLEIVAACFSITFWTDDRINNSAWVIIFLVLILSINFFGVKGYGEAEFLFSIVKVVAVIAFIVLALVLVAAGGPYDPATSPRGFLGGGYWHDPGAFNNGFRGLCSVFTTAAFAFSGTELVGLAAAETANPRKSLPTAVKQVFWRITLFYVVSLTLVTLLVPYNEPMLVGANDTTNSSGSKASPFVIAISHAGIEVLPSIMNVVILIAVLSVGNSAVFGSSRTLAALADQGQAPACLAYVDRRGRPLVAILVASALGFLAFFAGSSKQQAAFDWMIALSGLSSIFTWSSICLAHIRFRHAWRLQGHSLDELPFRSQPGIAGSWIGLLFNVLVLVAQFWTGFAPVGYQNLTAGERAQSWFQAYLAFPIALLSYVGYKLWWRTKIVRSYEMDLQTGRRDWDVGEMDRMEMEEKRQWSRAKRAYKFFC